ncbi:glycosyltransferase family 4 protein [Thiobacter aerophilum]|uniref:Glycosyltransferase family 4 protein n=1 Tax=Thiobacter aerophilum TaxID=3121275 RepID=A0ABV0ECV7_9BURK
MRLALVRQRYTPFGGAERFVARALEALRAQGVQVTLVTRHWEGAGEVLRCDPFYLGSLWRDLGFARCVCRALAAQPFDLVQSHERLVCCDLYRAGDGVHRVWLEQRRRTQSWFARLAQALNPYHRYVLTAERRLFESPRLKAVICNSRMVRDEILTHFAIDPGKLHVIYSGVDLARFHPANREQRREARHQLGLSAASTVFLFLGSGYERKGLATLLAAFAQLDAPAAQLLVVGRDRHARRYQRLAQRLGCGARTLFLGPREDVLSCYHAADALVLPTLYDPFPNVALEALACGLPVVTSTKSGAAEVLEEGVTGFVRDALDVSGIADALARLLHPAARAPMGQAARAEAERFNAQAATQALLGLYQRLLAGVQGLDSGTLTPFSQPSAPPTDPA